MPRLEEGVGLLRGVGEQAPYASNGVRPNSVGTFGGRHHGVGHLHLSDPSRVIVTLVKARVQSDASLDSRFRGNDG